MNWNLGSFASCCLAASTPFLIACWRYACVTGRLELVPVPLHVHVAHVRATRLDGWQLFHDSSLWLETISLQQSKAPTYRRRGSAL